MINPKDNGFGREYYSLGNPFVRFGRIIYLGNLLIGRSAFMIMVCGLDAECAGGRLWATGEQRQRQSQNQLPPLKPKSAA